MILIDTNQLCIAAVSSIVHSREFSEEEKYDEKIIRHIIINSLRANVVKFKHEYGEVVLCFDDKSWRKDIFPLYKASRHSDRAKSKTDWNKIFEIINKIKDEISENFPYTCIRVAGAEADDVIATLCKNISGSHIILSDDKDFKQLHSENIKQYSLKKKKFIECDMSPEKDLLELIIRGDESDGIPNILSDSDTFVSDNKRQSPIRKNKLEEWLEIGDPKRFCSDKKMLDNFNRNKKLIDLSEIPDSIVEEILNVFRNREQKDRSKIFGYLSENKLNMLLGKLNEF